MYIVTERLDIRPAGHYDNLNEMHEDDVIFNGTWEECDAFVQNHYDTLEQNLIAEIESHEQLC